MALEVADLPVSATTAAASWTPTAWRVRHTLNLDNVPAGVTDANDDNIVHDLSVDPATGRMKSAGGYGHPTCSPTTTRIAQELNESQPTGPEE